MNSHYVRVDVQYLQYDFHRGSKTRISAYICKFVQHQQNDACFRIILQNFANRCKTQHDFASFSKFAPISAENQVIFAKICAILQLFANVCKIQQTDAKTCKYSLILHKHANICGDPCFRPPCGRGMPGVVSYVKWGLPYFMCPSQPTCVGCEGYIKCGKVGQSLVIDLPSSGCHTMLDFSSHTHQFM